MSGKKGVNIYDEYEIVRTPHIGSAGPNIGSLPMRKNSSALHNPMDDGGLPSPLNYVITQSTPNKNAAYLNNSRTPN